MRSLAGLAHTFKRFATGSGSGAGASDIKGVLPGVRFLLPGEADIRFFSEAGFFLLLD